MIVIPSYAGTCRLHTSCTGHRLGHFWFFILISEMKRSLDSRYEGLSKIDCQLLISAWCLQGFATTLYAVFSIYAYIV
ncbi:hypothetical protein EV363DRAFT_1311578, partial [Boletus edulis]